MRDPVDDVLASWLLEVPSFSGRPILDHPLLPLLPHEGLEGLVYTLVHGLDNRSTAPRDDDYIRLACVLRDLSALFSSVGFVAVHYKDSLGGA